MTDNLYEAAESFVRWLDRRLLFAGRGDELTNLEVEPAGNFWLGRLAPAEAVINLGLGDRGERLDPCAVGLSVKPASPAPWHVNVRVRACAWLRAEPQKWAKSKYIEVDLSWSLTFANGPVELFGRDELERALMEATGGPGFSLEVRAELERDDDHNPVISISLVNISPEDHPDLRDTNLYECSLEVFDLGAQPFILESLPDAFRYDRSIPAYGINCGVEVIGPGHFATVDTITVDRGRPTYWSSPLPEPDLRFETIASDAPPSLKALLDAYKSWGEQAWSADELAARAARESWSTEMVRQAEDAADEYRAEVGRVQSGIDLLASDDNMLRAFMLMHEAITHSANARYDRWRPFQMGFLLANLASIVGGEPETSIADIVWFATGGGKTETYLGLLLTAAFYDRLRGKSCGMTAWTRFPLRMLSLQQTQRFADAFAGAEIVRRREGLEGEPFAVGFLVGQGATPNTIRSDPKEWEPDPDDDEMPAQFQVLLTCPFCHSTDLKMGFNRRYWTLEHRCLNPKCPWPETGLPFFIVDDEIYRFLPTVVVGTLDKAASISLQASMRGLVGPPLGLCSTEGHGFTYAARGTRPNGCLVPGCTGTSGPLPIAGNLFGPTFRLQDELHLLKDSLGAVDAHYEALLDHLQQYLCGTRPKILASSATLTGFEKQTEVLYRREGRVFPTQGPTATSGFWTSDTERLARRFVAVAPRGVTQEYATDRMLTELQRSVRRLISEPDVVCREAGFELRHVADLLSIYGVDTIYGNSLRDLEASVRSLETQIPVEGSLLTATLTSRTPFDEVRQTLERLDNPEDDFQDRLHVVAASSMMSHGVDIDRLNVMVVLGLPLTTAEFIQATARVGRRWPGLVVVIHKVARERDASVYRAFNSFIRQGDRFVEPVPITRRSRRVLERTIAGIELARVLAIHEPRSGRRLTTVAPLRAYFGEASIDAKHEFDAVVDALGIDDPLDEALREDLDLWFDGFFRNLNDPGGSFTFPKDLCPLGEPMISLRDVEEQAPIFGMVEK